MAYRRASSVRIMKSPHLLDLPSPPHGRDGWPWTVESCEFPRRFSNDKSWPKISIITPSYNQGQYLEETLRSVLLQGYPNLDFHVIDGGSLDDSVDIIRKYEPWLTSWVSERDGGQSDAINKGFSRCSGEIVNWTCSDDYLTPNSLLTVGSTFLREPEADVVAGTCFCQYDDDPGSSHTSAIRVPRGREFKIL
jgi:glycosyltransferase involved in cell wall biosynthesis